PHHARRLAMALARSQEHARTRYVSLDFLELYAQIRLNSAMVILAGSHFLLIVLKPYLRRVHRGKQLHAKTASGSFCMKLFPSVYHRYESNMYKDKDEASVQYTAECQRWLSSGSVYRAHLRPDVSSHYQGRSSLHTL